MHAEQLAETVVEVDIGELHMRGDADAGLGESAAEKKFAALSLLWRGVR